MHKALFVLAASVPLIACSGEDPSPGPSPMAASVAPPETGSSSSSGEPAAAQGEEQTPTEQPAQPEPPKPLGPATLYSVDFMNQLVAFSSDDASKTTKVAISGLDGDETISSVEYRASDKTLWGLGTTNRMYTIDPATGVATSQSPYKLLIPIDGTHADLDYDVATDRFRIVTNTAQNLRINPEIGAIVLPGDKKLAFAAGDANEGSTPAVSGIAHAVVVDALYGIDATLDVLTLHTDANAGVITTVGSLGVDIQTSVGFDIVDLGAGKQVAYLVARPPASLASSLYTVDLSTGQAKLVGPIASAALHGLTHTR